MVDVYIENLKKIYGEIQGNELKSENALPPSSTTRSPVASQMPQVHRTVQQGAVAQTTSVLPVANPAILQTIPVTASAANGIQNATLTNSSTNNSIIASSPKTQNPTKPMQP